MRVGVGIACAAAAYGWAQPATGWWLAAWCVPGLVLISTARLRPGAAFAAGALFGMLSAYATVSWAIDAALVYFDASRATATLFLLAVWAVMVGPWYGAVVVAYHAATRRLAPWTWPLVGGWLWAVGEWVRSTIGLPWCLLAHTQVEQSSLVQIADLGGAYAVTAVMAAVSIGGAELLVDPRRPGTRAGACVALGALAAALAYGRMRLNTEAANTPSDTVTIAVVQSNLANGFRWQRATTTQAMVAQARLTAEGLGDSRADLVVWPENAVNFYLDREGLMRLPLANVAGRAGGQLLVGAPRLADDDSIRSAAYLLDDQAMVQAYYDKRHLLPFGEYRPWPFAAPAGAGASYAPGVISGVLSLSAGKVGALICWDANFPDLARELVRDGAGCLVHLSNDAWLDGATHAGPLQHLAAVRFRAVETRRWIARAASTGPSGFVTATGALVATLPMTTAGVRTAAVPIRTDRSPYVRWGDTWLAVAGVLLWVAA